VFKNNNSRDEVSQEANREQRFNVFLKLKMPKAN
jgi:hypothetical protein